MGTCATRFLDVLVTAALVPSVVWAADTRYQYARVVGADPIYRTVRYSVPVEQCREETVARYDEGARSATVPIVGAIIGGAIGNAVGHHKRNKQVGTAVGAILGGTIGADVARRSRVRYGGGGYMTREVCSVVEEERLEEQLTGYRVTYRYAGETYTTTLPDHPGENLRVRVDVTPVG
jgi:uncharacterized protein YcfJ